MSANPIWIAGYFGPIAGAAPVWIAPGDGTVPSAVQSEIVSYYAPIAGATAVWIAGFFAPPPAAIGATPITISGWGGSGGGGPPPPTSVWSASDAAANGMTLSNGGLTVTGPSPAAWGTVRGSVGRTAGKLYVRFCLINTASQNWFMFGLASSGFNSVGNLGNSNYSAGIWPDANNYISPAGFTNNHNSNVTSGSPVQNDILALAVDFATGGVWIALNNVWDVGTNPATGTSPVVSFTPATVGTLFPDLSLNSVNGGNWTLQPTAASQKYAPPSGFSAWDGGAAPPPTSVWSSTDAAINSAFTLSNGGLTFTGGNTSRVPSVRGTTSHTSGKWYIEFLANQTNTANYLYFGLASSEFLASDALGSSNYSGGSTWNSTHVSSGFAVGFSSTAISPANNDVWGLAIDFTAGKIWLGQNNNWVAGLARDTRDPVSGALPIMTFVPATVGALFPAMSSSGATEKWTLQPTAASQKYAPPSGFKAWDAP